MDPILSWKLLLEAVQANQWHDMRDHADDLITWLDRGGFPPDTSGGLISDDYWNKHVARFACTLARKIARRHRRHTHPG